MSCLMTLRSTPYGLQVAKESLDVALVLSAFEQSPGILFIDEGVLQLLPTSHLPSSHKHIGKILCALEMYDINQLWVEQQSLDQFGLMATDLSQTVTVIDRSKVASLYAQYDQHLVF